MPRRLAVVMSHAPGLSGTPDSGHCLTAARSASCARSSASPTSRVRRVRPAISLADSIRQTASIAALMSGTRSARGEFVVLGEHLPDLRHSLPPRPVLCVELHELAAELDRLGPGSELVDREPADHFLSFGKWAVGDCDSP